MKQIEYILYSISFIILIIVIVAKSFLWPWAGAFLIISYQILAITFIVISWKVYSYKNESTERKYHLYSIIPFGLGVGVLLCYIIAKLQHWQWENGAFKISIVFFIITEIILATAFFLAKDIFQKDFIRKMLLKTIFFIALTLLISFTNFDSIICGISSDDANIAREKWEMENM